MDVSASTIDRGHRTAGRVQTILVLAVAVVVVAGLSWFMTGGLDDGFTTVDIAPDAAVVAPTVGQPPTPFSGVTYDGKPASLADYAGKPLWLTFGGSWCRDCRVEMPELIETYNRYSGEGLSVLGVFINEPAADTGAYAQRVGIPFPVVSDARGKIASAYRLMGVPTHVFIGRDGLIKDIKIGALAKDEMEAAVAAILR
ncbi:MAG TPA: TlpA disulfide reductase family protein [Candidatus Binatia bacterium]|nr:TlpA disulfide reductase family protein [Candidatus Binatia bacterium]